MAQDIATSQCQLMCDGGVKSWNLFGQANEEEVEKGGKE
jgi:hypothetical protein